MSQSVSTSITESSNPPEESLGLESPGYCLPPPPVQASIDSWIQRLCNLSQELIYDLHAYTSSALSYFRGYGENFTHYGLNPSVITAEQASKPAIILLHGAMANQSSWLPLAYELEQGNLGPVYTINYKEPADGMKALNQLLSRVKQQYAEHGRLYVPIDLVGHSLGAITSAAYTLLFPELHPKGVFVRKLIAIAGRLQITPGSIEFFRKTVTPLINRISQAYHKNPASLDLSIIAGSADRLVPLSSMLLHSIPAKQHIVRNRGHLSILFSKSAHKRIVHWLA